MKDKLKQFFSDKLSKKNIIIVIAVIGILCIALSEINFSGSEKKDASNEENYADYVDSLNNELTELISSIDGVGDCRVMITLKSTKESVYAKNTESSNTDSSNSENNEYVIYDGESGDSPLLLKEKYPSVEGVAVICSGGDNIVVKEKIIDCVCALFNISATRVSVAKLETKGDN